MSTALQYKRRGITIGLMIGFVGFLAYAVLVHGQGGTTFATGSGQGGLELKIDSSAIYNGLVMPNLSWQPKDLVPGVDHFFDFSDVKPGDFGEHTISLHVKKNDAYVCLDFINLSDQENGNTEPEALVDVDGLLGGELSSGLEFFGWMDDGDGRFSPGERVLFGTSTSAATNTLRDTSYVIADASTGTKVEKNETDYVGIYWCAGSLSVSLATGAVMCDGTTLGNGVQTDSMTVDVRLAAVVAVQQPNFRCLPPPVEYCEEKPKGNNGHGNDDDHNDDSNPGNSNDPDDNTDDDGLPPGQQGRLVGGDSSSENCIPKGNNGHGNDDDHNDDSNPGNSNDPTDDTDDDGLPPGFVKRNESVGSWGLVEKKSLVETVKKKFNQSWSRLRS